jgi:hypothetical protein
VNRLAVCLFVVGATIALGGLALAEDLSGAAYSTCQQFALDRLSERAKPHFPALGERGTGSHIPAGWRRGHYEVTSFVDTRNPFGAPVRSRLYCIVEVLGPNHWALDRIVIGDDDEVFGVYEPVRVREARQRDAEARRRRALIDWVAASFEQEEREATQSQH